MGYYPRLGRIYGEIMCRLHKRKAEHPEIGCLKCRFSRKDQEILPSGEQVMESETVLEVEPL